MTASGQTWDPDRYAANARFVSDLGMHVVYLLAPVPGERILDLGCGDGVLSAKIAALGCAVVGVDSSPAFVEAARADGLNIDARLVDGHQLTFDAEFDAVFSNAALHWMKRDPTAVIAGVWRALRPGGRFVAEFGGQDCVATITRALEAALERRSIDPSPVNPWYFPAPGEYKALLAHQGFLVESIVHFPRPTPLPGDVTGWLETFARAFLEAVPEPGRAAYLDEVRASLEPALKGDDGIWVADYTRIRFRALKPAETA